MTQAARDNFSNKTNVPVTRRCMVGNEGAVSADEPSFRVGASSVGKRYTAPNEAMNSGRRSTKHSNKLMQR